MKKKKKPAPKSPSSTARSPSPSPASEQPSDLTPPPPSARSEARSGDDGAEISTLLSALDESLRGVLSAKSRVGVVDYIKASRFH